MNLPLLARSILSSPTAVVAITLAVVFALGDRISEHPGVAYTVIGALALALSAAYIRRGSKHVEPPG